MYDVLEAEGAAETHRGAEHYGPANSYLSCQPYPIALCHSAVTSSHSLISLCVEMLYVRLPAGGRPREGSQGQGGG